MKKTILLGIAGILIAAVTFTACKKEDNNNGGNTPAGLDRKPMLTNYADNYILPAYAAMVEDLTALKTSSDAFVAAPDEPKLVALKAAWQKAYITWQKVDLLEFGPAENVSLRMYINTYPVTVSKLNSNISSGSYDLEQFGNKDAQGFPAIDYLLNGLAANNAGVVNYYTADAQAAARKQYLQAVVNKMLDKVTTVRNEWNSYRNTFVGATGTDVNSGISRMVNSYVLYYERYFRSGKIGLPVGAMTGTAKPDITEAYYTPQLANTLANTAMQSIIAFYEGRSFSGAQGSASMKSYLSNIGTKGDNGELMADLVIKELNEASTALAAINTPLKDAVQNNRTAVLDTYEQIQQVVPLLKVDMVSAFGISITYVDNDGD